MATHLPMSPYNLWAVISINTPTYSKIVTRLSSRSCDADCNTNKGNVEEISSGYILMFYLVKNLEF